MQHSIRTENHGAAGPEMARAIEACVHCGFCLPTCPTYVTMGEEMDSPRGRIFLMKEVLEGRMDPSKAEPYIDNCLGCLACTTACPSGVRYNELITPYRARTEPERKRGLSDVLKRRILLGTLPFPGRFRMSIRLGRLLRPLRRWLPAGLTAMLELVPMERLPDRRALDPFYPAKGKAGARVGLLTGCAQEVLSPGITRAAIRVLNRNSVDVVVPPDQACCGALALHIGADHQARQVARANLAAFAGLDAVITTAAGCASGIHEYGLLFKGQPEEAQALALAAKTRDICAFLDDWGYTPPANPVGRDKRVVYHDACHLSHGQGVTAAPRRLLKSIPGLQLLEPDESELCCGSAGTYNIEHPLTAGTLGRRKAENLMATGAEAVATGNIGCLIQLRKHLDALASPITIRHTVELLDSR